VSGSRAATRVLRLFGVRSCTAPPTVTRERRTVRLPASVSASPLCSPQASPRLMPVMTSFMPQGVVGRTRRRREELMQLIGRPHARANPLRIAQALPGAMPRAPNS